VTVRALILGAGGQVGRALVAALPGASAPGRAEFDISAPAELDWASYDIMINAAAFTDVDGAQTPDGRRAAWRANASGPAALAHIARDHGLTMVHLSSEYVFDGASPAPYAEDAPIAPLSAYGASKAGGDLAVRVAPRHYILRPTWVVGEGRNFVRTMLALAAEGVEPTVVADQIGRLTFATDLAEAIVHLVTGQAPFGTYHVTGGGEPASWADVARLVYDLSGHPELAVGRTTTADYFADKPLAAHRPLNSVLDLTRAAEAGVALPDWREQLAAFVRA